ncbi:MAG: pyruvate kinase [Elusimicrobia bacterium GWA2_56_46]|nr:MAG: pyruvate kinase [Elusimicrobia bacterium GWA2_56_46]OGR56198.1 MAG: pyruvate kinase [Elusimicrobia bacterium GWC2_56_31]HBB66915.1 pyruvate kinase [Elusimicrobiota bacterium]HBW23025.1 pyruvate kinase [Elusimicrobiota bacterium]
MIKTKIIATLGPASSSAAVLRKMFNAGLDVARINFSHGTRQEAISRIVLIRTLNRKYSRSIKLLADLKGNRIRIGALKTPMELKMKQTVFLARDSKENRPIGEKDAIPFDYEGEMSRIKKSFLIHIDDGNIRLEVVSVSKDLLKCVVLTPGLLREHKGVNIPQADLDFPDISEEDRADLNFAVAQGFDYIAKSFVRSRADVLAVVKAVRAVGGRAQVIAKIEAREALENISGIIEASDGIMIARGDMGIMFPIWQIPILQKRIISECNYFRKPVITATQMLESMTERKLPTRAEVSDVANAILDGSDYVMLSGETAVGKYPAETVRMMNEIIKYTEANRWISTGNNLQVRTARRGSYRL